MSVAERPERRRPRHRSIRWRLPLLICGLMLAAVTAFGWAAYQAVEQALLDAARERLENVSGRIAQLLDQSAEARLDDTKRLAGRPEVAAAFSDAGEETMARAAQALDAYRAASPQTLSVALWSQSGERLLERAGPFGTAAEDSFSQLAAPSGQGFSALQAAHDAVYYDVAVRVPAESATVSDPPGASSGRGYLVIRRLASNAGAGEALRGLMGGNTQLELGSVQGGVWTDMSAVVSGPPLPEASGVAEYRDPETGATEMGIARQIAGTPWTMWVWTPHRAVLAPARNFLLGMIPLTILIVGLGATVAWGAARQITKPLTELTDAAHAVTAGDLSQRIHADRQDELGTLGEAFNTMVVRVQDSHAQLDSRVRERTQDLTEALTTLRSTQEELVRREKLAMLGQLASSVGHELRNPLGVMNNAVYVLEMLQPDAPEQIREYHGMLRAQIGLSEKIISDLLDFARIKPPQREPVALRTLIEDQIARVSAEPGIEIVHHVPADLRPAFVDRFQMGQVLLNLVVNALQAMETEGGVLTLRGSAEGDRVQLEVTDTGPGVPPEIRQKIFDALFTTKARGIGLGLAVSSSLTEVNGGALTLRCPEGAGATFVLSLPTADTHAA